MSCTTWDSAISRGKTWITNYLLELIFLCGVRICVVTYKKKMKEPPVLFDCQQR